MATALPTDLPAYSVLTTSATPNVVTQVVPPTGTRRVKFRSRANAGKLVFGEGVGLADADPLGATAYVTLPADTLVEVNCAGRTLPGVADWLVTSATGSTEIEVIAE
jgi:hypothetical protein